MAQPSGEFNSTNNSSATSTIQLRAVTSSENLLGGNSDLSLADKAQIRQLGEIFPSIKFSIIKRALDSCNWNIDDCVAILANDSRRTTIEMDMGVVLQVNRDDDDDSLHILPKRRANKIVLPDDFLQIPKYRVIAGAKTADSIEFVVQFHRQKSPLNLSLTQRVGVIYVKQLSLDKMGEAGLATRAGIHEGDALFGINEEYFSTRVKLMDAIKVINTPSDYIKLHFRRLMLKNDDDRRSAISLGLKQTIQHHKFIVLLLDQELILLNAVEPMTLNLLRVKQRTMSWGTGVVSYRVRMKDIVFSHSGSGSGSSSSSGDISHIGVATEMSSLSRGDGDGGGGGADSKASKGLWLKDISAYTKGIQPGLAVRIIGAEYKVDHTEYIILVQDIRTGEEFLTKRRYREFLRFQKVPLQYYQ